MVWIWSVALLATLVAFAMAWRALTHAEHAVVVATAALEPVGDLTAAARTVGVEVDEAAQARRALHARLAEPPA